MGPMSSVGQYYDTLPQRFQAEAAKGVEAVFQWEITGDGGRNFFASVNDGKLTITEGRHEKPTVSLNASADVYLKIVNGEMNGTMAVMTRKMKVNGNIMLAKKMQQIFPIK
jgi:putative sterol carrier protein